MHTLTFSHETDQDAVFACTKCGMEIGFNKPGIGAPTAIMIDGEWTHPENPDQWMSQCES